MTDLPTPFNDIESDKENILPLKQGRSAIQLSQALRQDVSQLNNIRISYERRLMDELEEMDDPLELYLEYMQWINDAFPQGGSSKQSGMLDLMERCLMYLRDVDTYKNDPRYLKVWLWYIDLFARSSINDTKDTFVYMYRKKIGNKLALFYEEFANTLVIMTKFREALYVLENGLEENARPTGRLMRKLEEFNERVREMNIDLVSNKINNKSVELPDFLRDFEPPKMVLGKERDQFLQTSSNNDNEIIMNTQSNQHQNKKLQIFQDDENELDENLISKDNDWDMLSSKLSRNKENKPHSTLLQSGVNAGKLLQESDSKNNNETNSQVSGKISIFQDKIGRTNPVYKIVQIPGKKTEKIDVNFDLIYPKNNEEYCFEELLAISRNMYNKKPEKRKIWSDFSEKKKSNTNLNNPLSEKQIIYPPTQPPISQESSQSLIIHNTSVTNHQDQVEYVKTSILPLNDAHGKLTPKKVGNFDDITASKNTNSPTVTFFSKDAINEVYSMFNQNYDPSKKVEDNEENTTSRFAMYENTQDFTKQTLDDLTEVKPIPTYTSPKNNEVEYKPTEGDEPSYEPEAESKNIPKINNMMTPIKENKESSYSTTQSSPFLTQPNQNRNQHLIIDNPLSPNFRNELMSKLSPPLHTYQTFYDYNQPLKMSAFLKKIHRLSITENKSPIVDFKKTGNLYCIRGKLGEGGYATVYLAESSSGHLNALKVEKPASKWEYYILKQIQYRLEGEAILTSIIQVDSLHCFTDESYLVLKYANQGTLLDLINYYKNKVNQANDIGINEKLCMFFTVELIKLITKLHSIDIIHGDIKPDNCMIRFEKGEISTDYKSDGSNGWSSKGLYLIDFGRSFDMKILPKGTTFVADWKCDEQDCLEIQQGKEWSYEIDYFGLANMIHFMLFGEHISINTHSSGKLNKSFKRYWQKNDIWEPIFDTLINFRKVYTNYEVEQKLIEIQHKIEEYLIMNSMKNTEFRNEIYELESELYNMNLKI